MSQRSLIDLAFASQELNLNSHGTPCRVELDPDDPFGDRLVPLDPAKDVDPERHAPGKIKTLLPGDILALGTPETGGGRIERRRKVDHNPMTKKLLEKWGWMVEKAETYQCLQSGALIKHDSFGIADYFAVKPGERLLIVQACAEGQLGAHLRKFRDIPFTRALLLTGHVRIVVVAWDQPLGFGKSWEHKLVEITTELMDELDGRKRK